MKQPRPQLKWSVGEAPVPQRLTLAVHCALCRTGRTRASETRSLSFPSSVFPAKSGRYHAQRPLRDGAKNWASRHPSEPPPL
jgi:hypothetical protein